MDLDRVGTNTLGNGMLEWDVGRVMRLVRARFDDHDDTFVASGCRLAEMIRLFGGRDGAARRPLAKFRGGGGSRRRFFARGLIQLESRAQL